MGSGTLILLVDGLDMSRKAVSELLTANGYLVTAVGSEQAAARFQERVVPDMLIADSRIARPEAIRRAGLPFLVIVPRKDAAAIRRALDAGASEVLIRPLESTMLLAAVRLVLPPAAPQGEAVRLWFRQPMMAPIEGIADAWITNVSERGLGLDLRDPIDPGTSIVLSASFWDEVGIDAPLGKVLYCRLSEVEGVHRHRAGIIYVGLDHESQRRLRQWLYQVQARRAFR